MRWRGGETGLALLVTSPEGSHAGSEKGEEKVTGLHWTLPVGGAEAGLHASARCAWGQAQLVKHLWLSDSPKCFIRLEMSPDCNVPSTGYVRVVVACSICPRRRCWRKPEQPFSLGTPRSSAQDTGAAAKGPSSCCNN